MVLSCTLLWLQTCKVHIYLCSSCFKLLEEVISFYSSSETHVPFCVDVLKSPQDCHSLRVARPVCSGEDGHLGGLFLGNKNGFCSSYDQLTRLYDPLVWVHSCILHLRCTQDAMLLTGSPLAHLTVCVLTHWVSMEHRGGGEEAHIVSR